MLLRALATEPGLVGCFLEIAPFLLQDGRSAQTPPPAARYDWWADFVDNELASPCLSRLPDGPSTTAGPDSSGQPVARALDWWAELAQEELRDHQRPCSPHPGLSAVAGTSTPLAQPENSSALPAPVLPGVDTSALPTPTGGRPAKRRRGTASMASAP